MIINFLIIIQEEMINILFSTTRQWNPGDEFILFGIRNILDSFGINYNPIIYNRNPNIRNDSCTPINYKRHVIKDQYNYFLSSGICDNSIKGWGDWSCISIVIIAGTPEWDTLRCDEIYRMSIKYSIPVAFIGVDHIDYKHISHVLEKVLKKAICFTTRNSLILNDLRKVYPEAQSICCPAILSCKDYKLITKVKKVAFIYQGNKESITELAGVDATTHDFQLDIFKKIKQKYDNIDFSVVCHYVDEVLEVQKLCDINSVYYSYDAKDYEEIYKKFDLVIGCRIHGIGIAASLGIPGIPIIHDFRAGTLNGFIADECLTPISCLDSDEQLFANFEYCINNIEKINRALIEHKAEVKNKYILLFEESIMPQIGEKVEYDYEVKIPFAKSVFSKGDEKMFGEYALDNIKELLVNLNSLLSHKRVVIKGAGKHTQKLIKYLNEDINIIGIADVNGNVIEGYNNIDILTLKDEEYDYILVSSWLYEDDMVNELTESVNCKKIIAIYEILEQRGVFLKNDIFSYLEENKGWDENKWNLKLDNWGGRAEKLMSMLPPGFTKTAYSIMDLGAGGQHLKKLLNPEVRYIPVDYIKRQFVDEVIIRNFNENQFLEKYVDVMFASGILEYVENWEWFINKMCTYCKKYVLLAYNCFSDNSLVTLSQRQDNGWITNILYEEVIDCFKKNMFDMECVKQPYEFGIEFPETYFLFRKQE